MKLLFSLLAFMLINTECEQNKTDGANTSQSKEIQDTTIIYEALTRGFYEKIRITKDSISVTNDRNLVDIVRLETPEKDWSELMEHLSKIDVQSLPHLEAPTSMRHYDGARFATLMVNQNRQETKTESFDHGYPPKLIETLVNKVLSMREMVKK